METSIGSVLPFFDLFDFPYFLSNETAAEIRFSHAADSFDGYCLKTGLNAKLRENLTANCLNSPS